MRLNTQAIETLPQGCVIFEAKSACLDLSRGRVSERLGSRSFGSAGWFFISAERVVTVCTLAASFGAEQAGILVFWDLGGNMYS